MSQDINNEQFIRDALSKAWQENSDMKALLFDYWQSHKKVAQPPIIISGASTPSQECMCWLCCRVVALLKGKGSN